MSRKSVLIALVMILLCGSLSFAEFWESEEITALDQREGLTKEFKIVNLIMNGEDVFSDVPGILYTIDGASRTLLPLRIISESLGAEVEWLAATQQVKVTYENKEILLKLNSPIVYVNGVEKRFPNDIPPIAIEYEGIGRTMVPARFISEQLGMDVDWVNDTRTAIINSSKQSVESVHFTMENRFPEIRVKTSGKVEVSDFYIEKDNEVDQLVVDIINTQLASGFNDYFVPISHFYFDSISVDTYKKGTQNTRLTIGLHETRGYEVFYDEKSDELVIQFINSVYNIYTDEIYGVDAVIIDTMESPAYYPKMWVEKNKIIIDVMNSLMKIGENSSGVIDSESDLVSSIAYSQFDARAEYGQDEVVSRVVINLDQETSLDEVYVEDTGHSIVVYISGDPLNGFDYFKTAVDSSQLSLNFNRATTVVEEYSASSRNLLLEFNKSSIDIDELDLDIDDSIVQSFSIDKTSSKYKINVKLVENTAYELIGNGTGSFSVAFSNIDLSNSKFRDMTIVLDPGHGGKDPGASNSSAGVYEKNMALQSSLLLKKELEKEGFKVYMTRSTDQYISLYERANMANELNADLFISMHINAHTKSSVKGVEVLYNPYSTLHSEVLAKNILDELVSNLGAVNRGIVGRPNLIVIRETAMPAALVELGFISNSDEVKLLQQPSYMKKAVNAVKAGIIEFLD
jgi:N-acetylmuramoyl-L-alanine amidase